MADSGRDSPTYGESMAFWKMMKPAPKSDRSSKLNVQIEDQARDSTEIPEIRSNCARKGVYFPDRGGNVTETSPCANHIENRIKRQIADKVPSKSRSCEDWMASSWRRDCVKSSGTSLWKDTDGPCRKSFREKQKIWQTTQKSSKESGLFEAEIVKNGEEKKECQLILAPYGGKASAHGIEWICASARRQVLSDKSITEHEEKKPDKVGKHKNDRTVIADKETKQIKYFSAEVPTLKMLARAAVKCSPCNVEITKSTVAEIIQGKNPLSLKEICGKAVADLQKTNKSQFTFGTSTGQEEKYTKYRMEDATKDPCKKESSKVDIVLSNKTKAETALVNDSETDEESETKQTTDQSVNKTGSDVSKCENMSGMGLNSDKIESVSEVVKYSGLYNTEMAETVKLDTGGGDCACMKSDKATYSVPTLKVLAMAASQTVHDSVIFSKQEKVRPHLSIGSPKRIQSTTARGRGNPVFDMSHLSSQYAPTGQKSDSNLKAKTIPTIPNLAELANTAYMAFINPATHDVPTKQKSDSNIKFRIPTLADLAKAALSTSANPALQNISIHQNSDFNLKVGTVQILTDVVKEVGTFQENANVDTGSTQDGNENEDSNGEQLHFADYALKHESMVSTKGAQGDGETTTPIFDDFNKTRQFSVQTLQGNLDHNYMPRTPVSSDFCQAEGKDEFGGRKPVPDLTDMAKCVLMASYKHHEHIGVSSTEAEGQKQDCINLKELPTSNWKTKVLYSCSVLMCLATIFFLLYHVYGDIFNVKKLVAVTQEWIYPRHQEVEEQNWFWKIFDILLPRK